MKIVTKMVFSVVVLCSGLLNAAQPTSLSGYSDGLKANLLDKPGTRYAEFTVSWSQGKKAKQELTNSALSISELEQVVVISGLQDASSLAVTHMRDYLGLDAKKGSKKVADIIATHFAEKNALEAEKSDEKEQLRVAMAAVFSGIIKLNDDRVAVEERLKDFSAEISHDGQSKKDHKKGRHKNRKNKKN